MERIPFDVIINHIIPYTYHVQSNLLMEDIKNYHLIKSQLYDDSFDIFRIKHELAASILIYESFYPSDFITNHFLKNQQNFNKIFAYSPNTRFNILFGLLKSKERIQFLEHINQDKQIWFKK